MVFSHLGFHVNSGVLCLCDCLLIYVVDDILNKLLNITDKFEYNILWLKVEKSAHIDLRPLLNIPTIGIIEGPSRSSLTIGRRSQNMLRLEHQGLMVIIMPYGIK
jgi:hypothetical protein